MHKPVTLATLLLLALAPRARADSTETVEEIGDVIQFAIPITAAVVPTVKRDWNGLFQFGLSFGSTVGTVGIGKLVFDKRRPNEANKLSYPSGHSAASFSGAAFLQSRYGAAYGIPAYAAAAFVGYSRIQADQHYGDDVLAGASIALLYNWTFTRRYPEKLTFGVSRQAQGYAFGWSYDPDADDPWFAESAPPFEPKFKYEVEFSATWTDIARIQSPTDTGDPIDLDSGGFGDVDEPVPSTRGTFTWWFGPRHELALVLNPFEERDIGTFAEAKSFRGVTFPADTTIRSAYLNYEFRLRYRYDLLPDSNWILQVGASASFQWIDVGLRADSGETASVDDFVLLPLVGVKAGYAFSEKWRVLAECEGIYLGDDTVLDTAIWVEWQFARQWDLKLGYRVVDRDVDTSKLKTSLEQQRAFLGFGYRW